MSERMRESLSALLDGEANELEVERVLANIGDDPELRQVWHRYSAVRSVLSGRVYAYPELDISARVRAALAAEPPAVPVRERRGARLLRPLAGFAVAASVAATAVIGGQRLAQIANPAAPPVPSVATNASPVGMVNSVGGAAIYASYGNQATPVLNPAPRTAYQQLARQRMLRYQPVHAEQAALNSPEGMLQYARLPDIRQ